MTVETAEAARDGGVQVAPPSRRGQGPPLLRYLVARVVTGFGTLFVVSVLVFFGTNLLPGNAAEIAMGADSRGNPEAMTAALRQTGLDKPVLERYWTWITGLAQGDMGVSMVNKMPVADLIGSRMMNTATLSLLLMLLLIPLSLALGTWSAMRKDTAVDRFVVTSTMWGLSTPEFVVGTFMVVIFASWLDLLPSVSLLNPRLTALEQPELLVLPILSMLVIGAGHMTRLVRASTIEVLQTDFVQMAILRGVPTRTLLFKHVLPNSLGPTIQVIGLALGSLIGGVVVIEAVFNFPGMGTMLVQAVSYRDITVVSTIAMLSSAVYIVCNLLADILAMTLNPELRKGGVY